MRPADDPALPPAVEPGPTLRELVWGVERAADLAILADRLGPAARREGEGLHSRDPTGLALGFRVMAREAAPVRLRQRNQGDHRGRVNERLSAYGSPPALRIVHCAYNIPRAANEAALAFWCGPLGFKPVDKVLDTGTFLQAEGDVEHHNFFLCFRPDRAGINHIAVELWDFDAVMEAGNRMIEAGWKESRRPGRHRLGSNVYRFVHAPCGGRLEFVADMDRMDKDWQTRVWEKNPGHNIWMIRSSGPDPAGTGD
ncbi:Glyoxalase/Bleomycin resistance protein/Dioxygenase superfamily [Rubellimicrobium thermophilum DSM 16684]|uniref:Glyoxalase/Bleomycin resistance protein/Dioxygenase superfamily n=1 Tax=Rubellimicrobium thermophilum DSM 16684 TaxID=1123069 RepID=S9QTB3_9RHOB|nr:VOC family protein [Rubellimicrobium thermophilum]EPX82872.1 Glyoxalase/Bleomycin resistance protein/Dioxygenase superfamily [Rubellimicrobium thermophilum DSM 16684]